MQYKIIPTSKFEKDIKEYQKRYKNIRKDIESILEKLEKGELEGNVIPNIQMLDNFGRTITISKVRIANRDTKSGKSGGYRLIYYARRDDKIIYLITIYSKKYKENISNKEIQELVLKYCI